MRLSVIVPFLNSHELVRRHILYLKKMDLPDDVEILYMDDGSDPPLTTTETIENFHIIPTNEFRPWTSSLARNTAARLHAKGAWFLMTDGDYILSQEAIMLARAFDGDRMGFKREWGVLDENGNFSQDIEVLKSYGLVRDLANRGLRFSAHPNNFVMRREVFELIGGYREDLILTRQYPQREDTHFKGKLVELTNAGQIQQYNGERPTIYMFPNGQFCGDVDANPFDLFHTLSRKTPHNHWYLNPRYKEAQ